MNLTILTILLIFIILLFIYKADFVYFIPVFQVIVDIIFFYLGPGSLATYYRGIVLFIFVLYVLQNHKINFPLKWMIYAFLIFTGILTLQSAELYYSIKGYTQVFLSMIMLPVGFTLINHERKFARLNIQFIYIIFISVIITTLGYIFDVGREFNYGEDEQKIGLLGSAGLYSGAICIALLPILMTSLKKRSHRIATYVASVILYIFILLNMRRTAILIPFIGIIAFLFTTEKKAVYLSYIVLTIFLLIIGSLWYGDTLRERFEMRKETGRFEKDFYVTESRYQEVVNLTQSTIAFKAPYESLFGWGHNIFAEHVDKNKIVRRMYHTDFAKLLYGAGIVGLLIYLYICFKLLFYGGFRRPLPTHRLRQIKAMIFALAAINIALMFNGSLNLITLKSLIFLYLGALLRMYHEELINFRNRLLE